MGIHMLCICNVSNSSCIKTLDTQGTEDTVVPFALLSKLQALVPSVNAFALEAEGHSVVVENPDKCIECIKEITGFASSSRTDSRKESLKRRSSTRKKKHS